MKQLKEKSKKDLVLKLPNISLTIIEEDDKIIIHSDKDIFLSSSGNIISRADNYNVIFGRQIHLNPSLKKDTEKTIIEQIKVIEDEQYKK